MSEPVGRTAVGFDIGQSFTKWVSIGDTGSPALRRSSCETSRDLDQLRATISGLASRIETATYGVAIGGVLDHGQITSHRSRPDWVGERPSEWLRHEAVVLNDADATLIYHINRNPLLVDKRIVLLTLGTGVGSAAMIGGILIPNLELGFLRLSNGHPIHDAINALELQRIARLPNPKSHFVALLDSLVDTVQRIANADMIILAGQGATLIPPALDRPLLHRIDDPVFAGAIGALEIALDESLVSIPEYDGLARRSL